MTKDQIRQIQAAVAHQKAGRLSGAEQIYKQVLKETPDNFDCVYLLAMLYMQRGDLSSAVEMFRRAAKIRPDILDVHYNLAVALGMAGRHAEAAEINKRILDIDPRHPNARNNYAASLLNTGQVTEALLQYNELIASDPGVAEAYNNRGMALQSLKRFDEAVTDYDKAIALKPNFPQALVNRGNALAALQRADDALASYNRAITLQPDFADAYSNAGNIYCNRKSYDEALKVYDRALSLRPADSETRSMHFYAQMNLCDWSHFTAERSELIACIDREMPLYPFSVLAVSASADEELRCATLFAKKRFPLAEKPLWHGEIYKHDRIRVSYVSADFRPHAVSYLMAGLFECHDKSLFEVTAISTGPDDGSGFRRRLQASFERFIDVAGLPDDEIASRIDDAEADILVDLNGFTEGARMGIFAHRPAPMQVNYLGYPATTGAACIDYIIADRFVIPDQQQQYYSEKVVYLPNVFQANDAKRPDSDRIQSRADAGLPDDAFVFCSFNNNFKFTPALFDIWMRLLGKIEGSVLWLLEGNANVKRNLQKEAKNRGVDPARLIFAPRIAYSDYLARYRLADLFLDTFPFNAGTTASDALWAGLPLVTCSGDAFASRMAGSLLKAVGMPELITDSLPDYEALAGKLAQDPDLMTSTKIKLARNRLTCPLFNTQLFTKHIEAAYMAMYQRYQAGLPPDHIHVPQ
jgi:predicted O-linked N-acetylglucosamine transferase (SPINDLY family)